MTATQPPRGVIDVGNGFWNIRGSFKIAGIVDIGTQASLLRRTNGRFLLLDACGFSSEIRDWLRAETRDGADLDAVLHLHPFHTVHVKSCFELFPNATHYGTARHVERAPELAWSPMRIEDPSTHRLFAGDLELSVPPGVDFVPTDPNLHFASVLAFHSASKTLHVDDTLTHVRLPLLGSRVRFHPTLRKVLQARAGAAAEFRAWAKRLVERTADTENLCAAHLSPLFHEPVAERVRDALERVDGMLTAHERKFQ